MKMGYFTYALVVLGLLLPGYCSGVTPRPEPAFTTSAAATTINGTVVFVRLEGGFYGIRGDDGRAYDPINLPASYRQNGVRVRVTYNPYDGATFHQWGQAIEIVEISRL